MLVQTLFQSIPYAIMAGAVLLTFILHFALQRKFRQTLAPILPALQGAQTEIAALQQNLDEITARMQDAEERAGVLVPPSAPKSGLNLSRRTQVIRMARRGDRPDNIAASLSVPRREVELLLKVHRLAVDGRLPARNTE
jgi:hypothetical protein